MQQTLIFRNYCFAICNTQRKQYDIQKNTLKKRTKATQMHESGLSTLKDHTIEIRQIIPKQICLHHRNLQF